MTVGLLGLCYALVWLCREEALRCELAELVAAASAVQAAQAGLAVAETSSQALVGAPPIKVSLGLESWPEASAVMPWPYMIVTGYALQTASSYAVGVAPRFQCFMCGTTHG